MLYSGLSSPISFTDLFASDGVRLQPGIGARALAGFTAASTVNQAGILVANGDRTLLNGFVMEEASSSANAVQLARNEISFLSVPVGPPQITSQPHDRIAVIGATATFAVAASAKPAPAYQWFFNDTNRIVGATGATLTLSGVGPIQTGSYHVVVTNVHGAVTSSPALLAVVESAPVQDTLLLVDGTQASVFETALNQCGQPYQRFNDVSTFNSALAAANPASTLAIADVTFNYVDLSELAAFVAAGGRSILEYWALANGSLASAFGVSVAQAITVPPPLYSWGGTEVFAGLPTQIFLSDTFVNDGNMLQPLSGARAVAGYTLAPTANEAAIVLGRNSRTFVNGFLGEDVPSQEQATRIAANEIALVCDDPAVLVQPASQSFVEGQNFLLTVTGLGTAPLSYQWRRNGTNLAGATLTSISFTGAQASQAGSYDVVVSNSIGTVVSATAVLSLNLAVADAFNPGASDFVDAFAIQPDGKILVGGMFSSIGGQARAYLARFHPNGVLDPTFSPSVNDRVGCLTVQRDGKILVGGWFTSIAGVIKNRVARLNPNGTLDGSFNANVDDLVIWLSEQPDGKILVGGDFYSVSSYARDHLARLHPNGVPDNTFVPRFTGWFRCLLARADGSFLIGGSDGLARIYSNGSVDLTFSPGANSWVTCIAQQPDGKILIGGEFTMVGGQQRDYLARLEANGALDPTFNPGTDGPVHCLNLQADGKILIGGAFNTVGRAPRKNLARLNPDGTLDFSFNPSPNDVVYSLALQVDGKILAGGLFTSLAGQTRSRAGRLQEPRPSSQALACTDSTITWMRGGSGPEVYRTTFEATANGTTWTLLGTGQRVAGGWTLNAQVQPASAVRARGWVSGGMYGGSSWVIENSIPAILTADNKFGVLSNQFGFNVGGSPAGLAFVVEASTNSWDWAPMATNTFGTGPIYFSDPDWQSSSEKLYRVRSQ